MRACSSSRGVALGAFVGIGLALAGAGAAADAYQIDRDHCSVYFAVAHRDISLVRGRFARLAASVDFDPQAKIGTLTADVDAASVDTGNATLDAVLRSAQFLDVAAYPEVRYVGDRFVFDGDALTAIEGRLWLHGVMRPLRLAVARFACRDVAAGIVQRQVCGGSFRAAFDRADYGLTRFLPDVGNRIELDIEVEAARP